jgi:hypothetical protein
MCEINVAGQSTSSKAEAGRHREMSEIPLFSTEKPPNDSAEATQWAVEAMVKRALELRPGLSEFSARLVLADAAMERGERSSPECLRTPRPHPG